MKKFTTLFTLLAMLLAFSLNAQVAINQDGSNANIDAVLHVKSGTTTFVNSLFIHKTTGNIGIRTLTPACPLQFISQGDDVWLMQWDNNDASNGAPARFQNTDENNGNRVLMGSTNYSGTGLAASAVIGLSLNDPGEDGIGVYGFANDEDAIGVYGGISRSGFYTGWAGYFDAKVYSAGGYYQPSDKKLKKDINEIIDALEIIDNIRPVSFYYNTAKFPEAGFETELSYGFIAQELEEILPTLVSDKKLITNSNIKKTTDLSDIQETEIFKVVNYTEMIPILTKAIKEQQEIIENLEQRLAELERKVNNQ